jgi:hypothetical protein
MRGIAAFQQRERYIAPQMPANALKSAQGLSYARPLQLCRAKVKYLKFVGYFDRLAEDLRYWGYPVYRTWFTRRVWDKEAKCYTGDTEEVRSNSCKDYATVLRDYVTILDDRYEENMKW